MTRDKTAFPSLTKCVPSRSSPDPSLTRRVGPTTTVLVLTRSVSKGLTLVPAPTGRDSRARVGAQRRPGIWRRLIPTALEPHPGRDKHASRPLQKRVRYRTHPDRVSGPKSGPKSRPVDSSSRAPPRERGGGAGPLREISGPSDFESRPIRKSVRTRFRFADCSPQRHQNKALRILGACRVFVVKRPVLPVPVPLFESRPDHRVTGSPGQIPSETI
jgi:hypothetical protein